MEIPPQLYSKAEYIETSAGNKVSRQSVLCGSQNILLNGKTIIMSNCVIRGDLANIKIGRNCVISKTAVVRPPFKKFSKGVAFFPMTIGDHVFIDEGSIINAAQIGSYVHIGKNAVIGRRSMLRDCCAVADDAVVAPETVVPPFSLMAGNPGLFRVPSVRSRHFVHTTLFLAKIVAELPECTQELMIDATRSFYQNFKPDVSAK